jgi:hypothetical protein
VAAAVGAEGAAGCTAVVVAVLPAGLARRTAEGAAVEIVRRRSAAIAADRAPTWGHPRRQRARRSDLRRLPRVPEGAEAIARVAVGEAHRSPVEAVVVAAPGTSTFRIKAAEALVWRVLAADDPASTIGRRPGRDREARASPTDRRRGRDRGELAPSDPGFARVRGATGPALAPVKVAAVRNVREFVPAGAATGSPAVAIVPISLARGTGPAPMGGPAIDRAGMIRGGSTTGRTG